MKPFPENTFRCDGFKKHSFFYRNGLSITVLAAMILFWIAQALTGWHLKLYSYSLSIMLFLLFVMSFCFHFWGSLRKYNAEQALDQKPPTTAGEYIGNAYFWFESFQNWQSEFLAVAAIVLFSIFLREKGSPESKKVNAPHSKTGD